jgi:hypothetical protein
MRFRSLGAVAVAAALLAACDFGDTRDAVFVGDTSARLEGLVHTDSAEDVLWWFEYGPTAELGEATPQRGHTSSQAGAVEVAAVVTGLDEATTYHYRLCVLNEQSGGVCGAQRQFTTTAGTDSVLGIGVTDSIPELGFFVGAVVEATSEPDGTSPAGHASRSPGEHHFRVPDEGPVTCLRVQGNRATVGFTADYSEYDPTLPPVHVVLHIEDNGAIDDRFESVVVAAPTTTCPLPDATLIDEANRVVSDGDAWVVHDHG